MRLIISNDISLNLFPQNINLVLPSLNLGERNIIWMKNDRREKVEASNIWNSKSHKLTYNSLKALKLTFANDFMCKKITVEQFGKPQGYRMDFFKCFGYHVENTKLHGYHVKFPLILSYTHLYFKYIYAI